jgi:hypothetical protein
METKHYVWFGFIAAVFAVMCILAACGSKDDGDSTGTGETLNGVTQQEWISAMKADYNELGKEDKDWFQEGMKGLNQTYGWETPLDPNAWTVSNSAGFWSWVVNNGGQMPSGLSARGIQAAR